MSVEGWVLTGMLIVLSTFSFIVAGLWGAERHVGPRWELIVPLWYVRRYRFFGVRQFVPNLSLFGFYIVRWLGAAAIWTLVLGYGATVAEPDVRTPWGAATVASVFLLLLFLQYWLLGPRKRGQNQAPTDVVKSGEIATPKDWRQTLQQSLHRVQLLAVLSDRVLHGYILDLNRLHSSLAEELVREFPKKRFGKMAREHHEELVRLSTRFPRRGELQPGWRGDIEAVIWVHGFRFTLHLLGAWYAAIERTQRSQPPPLSKHPRRTYRRLTPRLRCEVQFIHQRPCPWHAGSLVDYSLDGQGFGGVGVRLDYAKITVPESKSPDDTTGFCCVRVLGPDRQAHAVVFGKVVRKFPGETSGFGVQAHGTHVAELDMIRTIPVSVAA